jgi:hypothetical protein
VLTASITTSGFSVVMSSYSAYSDAAVSERPSIRLEMKRRRSMGSPKTSARGRSLRSVNVKMSPQAGTSSTSPFSEPRTATASSASS